MRAGGSRWLRALAVVLLLFALGHTLGTASPRATRGFAESAVFAAMQHYRFPVAGFERSYWDFYRGFAFSISVLLAALAAIAWQAGGVAIEHPAAAWLMAMTLLVACLGLLVIGVEYFFAPPIAIAALAVVCAGMAVLRLGEEMQRP